MAKSEIPGIELIIIDNANSEFESPTDKIRILKQKENIYVNPAWNLGVKEAKNDYVCLLNDDININLDLVIKQLFSKILNVDDNFGMFAIQPEGFSFSKTVNKDTDELRVGKLTVRGAGFGMFMVFHKSTYVEIPPQFKIFFGDDVLFLVNNNITKRNNYVFSNLKVTGQFSVTSHEYEANGLIQDEFKFWDDTVRELYLKYSK